MGLVSSIVGLPLLPLHGLLKLGSVLQQQVDQELHGQPAARRQLEAIDAATRSGRMSTEERARDEQEVLNRMMGQAPAGSVTGPPERS